jgi:hypothetical protein
MTISSNALIYNDPLIYYGSIHYSNFSILMNNISFYNNTLSQGSMIQTLMNIKNLTFNNCNFTSNEGSIVYAMPAFTDSTNPMGIYVTSSTFFQNSGKANSLIIITTNTIFQSTSTVYQENYSYGRGSIILADYKGSQA